MSCDDETMAPKCLTKNTAVTVGPMTPEGSSTYTKSSLPLGRTLLRLQPATMQQCSLQQCNLQAHNKLATLGASSPMPPLE